MGVGEGLGEVTVQGLAAPAYPYTFTFKADSDVMLEAVPAPGYLFKGWRGYITGRNNPVLLNVSCDMGIAADFARKETPALAIGGGTIIALVLAAIIIVRVRTAS